MSMVCFNKTIYEQNENINKENENQWTKKQNLQLKIAITDNSPEEFKGVFERLNKPER